MSEQRKIRFDGKVQGPHSLDQLNRMAKRREFDRSAEFFSIITEEWLPLAGIMEDFDPSTDRLKQLRKAGIKEVGIIGTEDACSVCLSLCRKTYSLGNVPRLPPKGCTCFPWWELSIGAVA